jgi:hypothetical protein
MVTTPVLSNAFSRRTGSGLRDPLADPADRQRKLMTKVM